MYLRVKGESFGFISPDINEIEKSDVIISDDIYIKFFELQSQGKEFIIKDSNGLEFEDIFKEVTPINKIIKSELELKLEILENENADLLLDSVKKDIRIEQNELDIADLLLVVGGM